MSVLSRLFQVLFAVVFVSNATLAQAGTISAAQGETIRLDATPEASFPTLTTHRVEWVWISRPALSVADFSDSTALRPDVTLDVPGQYEAEARFFDLNGAQTDPVATARVVFGTGNLPPEARVTARGLPGGDTPLTLDGSASSDANGDALTYAWTLVSGPAGSSAALDDASAVMPKLSLDLEGAYTVGLTVTDAAGLASEQALYDVVYLPNSGDASVYRLAYDRSFTLADGVSETVNLGDRDGAGDHVRVTGFEPGGTAVAAPDSLTLTLAAVAHTLSDRQSLLDFATLIELDADDGTNVKISPDTSVNDMTFLFGPGRGSVTLRDVLDDATVLNRASVLSAGADVYEGVGGRQVAPEAAVLFSEMAADVGAPVVVDAWESTDIDGSVLVVRAGVTHAPAGSAALAEMDLNGRVTLVPDVAGTYLLTLEVDDGGWLRQAHVVIEAGTGANLSPVARIEPVTAAPVGTALALDGRQSFDLNGDLITHDWALLHAPASSSAMLTDTDAAVASFTPDVAGDYVVQLTVRDAFGAAQSETLLVRAGGALPVADAGADQLAGDLGQVTLDGTLSSGGAGLSYGWAAISLMGDGATGDLNDASAAMPGFGLKSREGRFRDVIALASVYHLKRADKSGLCQFDVRLPGDLATGSASDPVRVTLHARGKVQGGSGQVWEIENKKDYTREVVLLADDGSELVRTTVPGRVSVHVLSADPGKKPVRAMVNGVEQDSDKARGNRFNRNNPVCTGPGASVVQLAVSDANGVSLPDTVFVGNANLRPVLSGAGRFEISGGESVSLNAADYALDANGDALSFGWSLIARPQGSAAALAAPVVSDATVIFTPDRVGTYLLQLVAMDDELLALPLVIEVEVVNAPPVAVASGPAERFVGETATLDGSASFDPDGDALTYRWQILSQPTGSTATIPDPFGAMASFVPDRRGDYVFELVVSDYEYASAPATVTLTAPNRAPVAVFEGVSDIDPGTEAILSAAASADPDNDPLSFTFEAVTTPAGAAPVLVDLGDGELSFVADLAGEYVLRVTVSDGLAQTSADFTITASPRNTAPVLGQLRDTYTVELGLELALDLTGSDADGDPISFYATPLPLVSGATLDAQSGALRFRPEAGQEGSYSVTLGVSDGTLTDTATVVIEVVPGSAGDTALTGRVLDAADYAAGTETPLANMPVRLRDAALATVTDASGAFSFGSLVAGSDLVIVEPDASGGPGGYLSAAQTVRITANQIRDIDPDVLLTPLNEGCATPVAGQDTVLSGTQSGVTVTIPADSVTNSADNTAYTGEICLGTLPQRFVHTAMPVDTTACTIHALNAPGASFAQPISIQAPNVDQLPEGARLNLWALQGGSAGAFVPTATGQVDAGGQTVSATIAANGALSLTFLPQAPALAVSDDMPSSKTRLMMYDGNMSTGLALSDYQALGRTQGVSLAFNSKAADPAPVLAADVTIAADSGLPVSLASVAQVGGVRIGDLPLWSPRLSFDGSTPALIGEAVALRQSAPVDGTGLPSGRHDYRYTVQANYACSTIAADVEGELLINNGSDSPYGRGWAIDGLQRLEQSPDGRVAIMDDDSVTTFDPAPTITEFQEDPIIFPTVGTQNVDIADFNGDGLPDVSFAQTGTGELGTILNRGNGEFELTQLLTVANDRTVPETGTYPPNLTGNHVGDLNGDGAPDVAYVRQGQNGMHIAYNDGQGTLSVGYEGLGLGGYRDVAFGDFDRDGILDVAVARTVSVYVFFDIYYGAANPQDVLRRDFREIINRNGRSPLQALVADFNSDGRDDFAFRDADTLKINLNNNDNRTGQYNKFDGYTALSPMNGPNLLGKYVAVIDANRDGAPDIVWSAVDALQVYLNDGTGQFPDMIELARPPAASDAGYVAVRDVDGDEIEDIIFSTSDIGGGSVYLYSGLGDGTFEPFEEGQVPYSFGDVAFADLNGDGSLDLVSAQRFSVTIQFSDPSKSGTFISGGGDFSELTRLEDGTWERRYPDGTIVSFDANGLQTGITDTNGNTKTYAYGADGRLATITDEMGGVTTFAYQADGRLASITYPDGRVNTFEYDDLGGLTAMNGADGSTRRYAYNENGQLIGATDPNGNLLQYSYNDAGAYSGATYPNGTEIGFRPGETIGLEELNTAEQPLPFYPPEERVTLQTDERGGVSQITLNQYGSVIETIDPLGRYVRYERNADNLVTAIERPTESPAPIDEASLNWGLVGTAFAGVPIPQRILDMPVRRDEMDYDVNGNVIARRQAVGTTLEREERFEYSLENSRLLRHVDEGGFETVFTYDAFGNMATVTDAEGNSIAYTYDDRGLTETYTDERGFVTTYTYNQYGNVETATLPDGTVYRRVYDTSGNVVQEIEAEGAPQQRTLVQSFDAYNRLLSAEVLDANGVSLDGQMTYAYDAAGNKVRETDETGIETRYTFDAMNKLFFVETPGYGRTTYFRDAANDVTAIIDAEDAQHLLEYDVVGRLIRETDAEGNVSTYSYDVYDNLTQVIDGRGNVTNFTYDIFNRQVARTNPLGQTSTTAYDSRDNLTVITRENGDEETATYDGLSRRVQVTTPDNVVTYSYDAAGNLLAANDNDSGLSFAYDNRDRLITATTDGTVGPQPGIMLSYSYDALGQRQSLSDSLGGIWTYGFDEKSRVTSITAPWGDVHNMEYDPAGRRTELTNQSGRATLAAYADDRLSQLEHFMSGAPVARSGFDYAADGQISLLRDLEDVTASRSLSYDAKNQLIQVARGTPVTDGGAPVPVEDYAYDPVGNRTESTSSLDYVVDDHNRLLETSDYLYTYDAKGNRTTRTRKSDGRVETYVYNSMNQLTEVTSTEGLVARYAYDALGRRIAKTVNGTVTAYVHDISDMADVTTHDRLLEFVNGALTTRWLHGQNIDEAVGFERYSGATVAGSGQAYALHADRQGASRRRQRSGHRHGRVALQLRRLRRARTGGRGGAHGRGLHRS